MPNLFELPEYRVWRGAISRCENKNDPAYPRYGGRGIRISEDWRYNFLRFLADMGRRPSANYSLDRINNDGNYEFGNCRWATALEQAANSSPRGRFNHSVQAKIIDVNLASLIKKVGNKNRLAKYLGVSRQAVDTWSTLPSKHKDAVERLLVYEKFKARKARLARLTIENRLKREIKAKALRPTMHLSDFMRLKNLTDAEVADQIGVSRVTVNRIRRRMVRPDWETITKLNRMSRGAITANDFAELENG